MATLAGLIIVALMISGAVAPTTGWLWGLLALFAVAGVFGGSSSKS